MMNKRRIAGLSAIALSLCLLAVSLLSPVLFEQEEVRDDEITLAGMPWDDWKDENGNYRLGNIFADVLSFISPPVFIGKTLYDGIKGNGSGGGGSGGDPAEIAKYLREHESELVYTVLNTDKELLTNSINGYSDIWKLSNSYWMRQAEVAAAERWASSVDYYAPFILERSGLIANLIQLFDNVEAGPDTAFAFLDDRLQAWSADSQYRQMKIYFSYGDVTKTDSLSMGIKFRNAVTVSSDYNGTVYLDKRELYVFGGNATIYAEDGTQYQLASGYNDLTQIAGFEPGIYALQKDRSYAGSIVPCIDARAAQVYASAVLQIGSDVKLAKYSNSLINIDNTNYDSLEIYVDTGDGKTSEKINLTSILEMNSALVDATYTTLSKSHAAAQAAWMVFDKAKESNILISPSALIPNLQNIDVSAEEMYTLTVLYLEQIYDYWQRTNGNLKDTGFNLSADSLDLYVRGNVYDENGNMIYSSVVFTPYIWLNSMVLTEGRNTFNQPGVIGVWGESGDLTSWKGTSGYTPTMISIKSGYSVEIAQIMYDDAIRTSVTLDVMEIEPWYDPVVTPGPGTAHINVSSLVPYVAAILFLIGLNLCQFSVLSKFDILMLVGAIFIILAFVGAEWIAGYL